MAWQQETGQALVGLRQGQEGNALGAWVGGSVIAHGFGLTSVPLAAAVGKGHSGIVL